MGDFQAEVRCSESRSNVSRPGIRGGECPGVCFHLAPSVQGRRLLHTSALRLGRLQLPGMPAPPRPPHLCRRRTRLLHTSPVCRSLSSSEGPPSAVVRSWFVGAATPLCGLEADQGRRPSSPRLEALGSRGSGRPLSGLSGPALGITKAYGLYFQDCTAELTDSLFPPPSPGPALGSTLSSCPPSGAPPDCLGPEPVCLPRTVPRKSLGLGPSAVPSHMAPVHAGPSAMALSPPGWPPGTTPQLGSRPFIHRMNGGSVAGAPWGRQRWRTVWSIQVSSQR